MSPSTGKMEQQNDISAELLKQLVTCSLYGSKTVTCSKRITDINQLRYAMFCAKRGKIESYQLPPSRYSLRKHARRARIISPWQCLVQKSNSRTWRSWVQLWRWQCLSGMVERTTSSGCCFESVGVRLRV